MDFFSVEFAFLLFLVAFLLQSIGLAVGLRWMGNHLGELDEGVTKMTGYALDSVSKLHDLMEGIAPVAEQVPRWGVEVRNMSDKLLESAREGDERLARSMERLRGGVDEARRKMDQGLQGFSHYSFQVHQGITRPAQSLSDALMRATNRLKSFFRRSPSHSPEFVADDEGFV